MLRQCLIVFTIILLSVSLSTYPAFNSDMPLQAVSVFLTECTRQFVNLITTFNSLQVAVQCVITFYVKVAD